MAKKTTQQFIDQLSIINPSIRVIGEYKGSKEKIEVECLECGNVFSPTASSLLSNHGCNKCATIRRRQKQLMPVEEFDRRLFEVSPNLKRISDYYNATTRLKVKCLTCGKEYAAYPNNLLRGYNCRQCYLNSHLPRSKDEFQELVLQRNPNIIVGDDYKDGKHTKCTFICKICGYSRQVIPNLFLSNGCTCPKCDGNLKMTPDEYRDHIRLKNENIIVVGDYSDIKAEIQYKCNNCGNSWIEMPDVFKARDYRCKCCETISSKLENDISDYLNEHNIEFVFQKSFDDLVGIGGGKLSYDFYIPSFNLLIEAQGRQHFEPVDYFGGYKNFERQKEHDRRKKEYANNHNYSLLEVCYFDQNKIKNILDKCFGKTESL